MAKRKWNAKSRQTIAGRLRFVWVDENGNKIVRRRSEDYYLETPEGIYDPMARNFKEAVDEIEEEKYLA